MTRESESSNEQPQRNTEIDDSILTDARSDTAPALIRESVGNVMASALSSRRSAGTSSVKVSTKNSFDGDAAKFPLWRIKQLAIFRCSGVAAILKDAVPDEGSDDRPAWDLQNEQLHDLLIINLPQASMLLVRESSERVDGRDAWLKLCNHYESNTSISKSSLLSKLYNTRQMKGEKPHEFALRIKESADVLQFVHNDKQPETNLTNQVLINLDSKYSTIGTILRSRLATLTFDDMVQALTDEYESHHIGNTGSGRLVADGGAHNAIGGAMPQQPRKAATFQGNCNKCGKKGHKAADCRGKAAGKWCTLHKTSKHDNSECKAQNQQPGGSSDSGGGGTAQHAINFSFMAQSDDQISITAAGERIIYGLLDSGATSHIIDPDLCMLNGDSVIFDCKPLTRHQRIKVGGGAVIATHTGCICISVQQLDGSYAAINVRDALIIPGFGNIIFSLVTLENSKGAYVQRETTGIRTLNMQGGSFKMSTRTNVYALPLRLLAAPQISSSSINEQQQAQAATAMPLDADDWHQRLGHCNMRIVEKTAAIADNGVSIKGPVFTGRCSTCHLGKSAQIAHPKPDTPHRADKPCAIVMMDVYGPVSVTSLGGANYAVAIVDSCTRMAFLYTMPTHDAQQILRIWRNFITQHVVRSGRHVLSLRTDNAKEFGSNLFMEYNRNAGIEQEFSSPYTPQQMGLVESLWKPLAAFVRMSLASAHLPEYLWAELMHTKVHLRNRVPMMSNPGHASPYALWFGSEPNLSYTRIIGSAAFVHEERHNNKLEPRAWEGKLVGYNHDSNKQNSISYRIFNASDGHVHVSRNVTFIEPISVTPTTATGSSSDTDSISSNGDDGEGDTDGVHASDDGITPVISNIPTRASTVEHTPTPTATADTHDARTDTAGDSNVHDDTVIDAPANTSATSSPHVTAPMTKRARQRKPTVVQSKYSLRSQQQASTALQQEEYDSLQHMAFMAACDDEYDAFSFSAEPAVAPRTAVLPISHEQAMQSEQKELWLAAEHAEIASLSAFDVYEWAAAPTGTRIHKSKWVYAYKYNAAGDIVRCKARFVACGYSQVQGEDYFDAFAPVARLSTYRGSVSFAAQHDYEIRQLDVKTAFLQAELEEDIYVQPPVGYEHINSDGTPMCWRLKRSLYGLVQAARCWYLEISSYLTTNGFTASTADPCLFVNEHGVLLVLYVDDMIITGGTSAHIQAAVDLLKRKYDIKDMGELKYCLGIAVKRDMHKHSIQLSQQRYVEDLLQSAGMADCNTAPTPAPLTHSVISRDAALSAADSKTYRSIIGSLMYLATATRPDISYAVAQLSRHMIAPTDECMRLAKHVLRYLKGHQHSLTYMHTDTFTLTGYVDADWAADSVTRKSTTGYVFTLGDTAIAWKCKMQPIVATSTTYAEYIALSTAAQEAIALRRLFTAFRLSLDSPTIIHEDNAGAISISEYQGSQPERSKHIDVRYHYIRELIKSKQITVQKINTTQNVADMFTKALGKDKHSTFTHAIMNCSQ